MKKPRALRVIDLLRPHWKAMTMALVEVGGAAVAYHHIHRLSLAEHEPKRTGDLTSRVTSDIDSIQDFVASAMLGIVASILTLLGIVGIMLYASWRFTLYSGLYRIQHDERTSGRASWRLTTVWTRRGGL